MNYTVGDYFRFTWADYEIIAVCINIIDDDPLFQEEKSKLQFALKDAGNPKIEAINPAVEALKNYKPDLERFAPIFMGLRQKDKDE